MSIHTGPFVVALLTIAGAAAVAGQAPDHAALVAALREGGHVVVMRHASAPSRPPDAAAANPDNPGLERQLDAAGRAAATAMGEALRRLKIPIGDVLSSPTYRARETVRYAGLPDPTLREELGDGGQSMKRADDTQVDWLRARTAERPQRGNTVIVTHQPNIARAFPQAADVAEGEALVFKPEGRGGVRLVGRVPIAAWKAM